MDSNEKLSGRADVAAGYAHESDLQPPEETILRNMLPLLPTSRMLDIGIGGGRTTIHFAKRVREYVGTDYSESMVAACEQRFSEHPDNVSFKVCDARSMEMFEADSFDFILFSFNGIDYVAHEDRRKIIKEIHRVGKLGGTFAFSTHNLNSAVELFEWRRMISFNSKRLRRTVKRLLLRFFYNRHVRMETIRNAPYARITDGAHKRKLVNYYIRPTVQVEQLEEYFTDIQVFSLATGGEIEDRTQLESIQDSWLYYLCRIK